MRSRVTKLRVVCRRRGHRQPSVAFLARSEGAGDVLRPLHPLAPVANRAAQVGVAAADVARPILVVRHDEVRDLDGNSRAVQHDGKDRDAAAHGRLETEAVMSNAASLMTFTQNLSGAASSALMMRPRPVPSPCALPHPG